jgi:hypothetical protein
MTMQGWYGVEQKSTRGYRDDTAGKVIPSLRFVVTGQLSKALANLLALVLGEDGEQEDKPP